MRSEYLILLGLCAVITLPLEVLIGARVYRRPLRLLTAMAPVLLVFLAWDYLGIHRKHWWYSPDKITGVHLPGGLPLEELLFFLVIPICGLLTFEAVDLVLGRARRQIRPSPAGSGRRDSTTHREEEDPHA